MESLLHHLREGTRASHALLDSAFGSLNLNAGGDYRRFLRGHALGLAPLFDSYRRFVEGELAIPAPDYPAMLRADLDGLDEDLASYPAIAERPVQTAGRDTDAAVAYVVGGSRLGLAVIRKGGYWGAAHGQPSAYMDDDRGLAVWKSMAAWLKDRQPTTEAASAASAAAVAAFDIFRDAFDASELTSAR